MIYLKIENEIYKKIQEITLTDYEEISSNEFVLINETGIESIISDLIVAYNSLTEEFEKYKQNIADNYRQIPVEEQVGISDRDFI